MAHRAHVERIRLVPAQPEDAESIFRLRNDPWIVAQGEGGRTVEWAEHSAWYSGCLAKPESHQILLVEEDRALVGVVRFDRTAPRVARISIYLAQSAVGRGVGTYSISLAARQIADLWDVELIHATVRRTNQRSLASFVKAGFVRTGSSSEPALCQLELKIARGGPS